MDQDTFKSSAIDFPTTDFPALMLTWSKKGRYRPLRGDQFLHGTPLNRFLNLFLNFFGPPPERHLHDNCQNHTEERAFATKSTPLYALTADVKLNKGIAVLEKLDFPVTALSIKVATH